MAHEGSRWANNRSHLMGRPGGEEEQHVPFRGDVHKLPALLGCQDGLQTQFAQRLDNVGRKAEAVPNRIFQSFRRFFGRK